MLAGYFEYVFLTLFIIIIHEMGHFFSGKLLGLKMKEIKIFAFGGVTFIDEELNSNIYKEILMLISGPLIQLLLLMFICYLNKLGYVNVYTYQKFTKINYILFSFNLLPIIPLDGGKLLNNILDIFLPYQMSHLISIIISIIFLPSLLFIDNKLFMIILTLFLLFKIIDEIKIHKDRLNKLIIERNLKVYNFKKTRTIKNINKIRRNENYILSSI